MRARQRVATSYSGAPTPPPAPSPAIERAVPRRHQPRNLNVLLLLLLLVTPPVGHALLPARPPHLSAMGTPVRTISSTSARNRSHARLRCRRGTCSSS